MLLGAALLEEKKFEDAAGSFEVAARLSPNNQERLVQAFVCLRERLGGGVLVLEAHVDGIGDEAYNLALSERRGATVRDFQQPPLSQHRSAPTVWMNW